MQLRQTIRQFMRPDLHHGLRVFVKMSFYCSFRWKRPSLVDKTLNQ